MEKVCNLLLCLIGLNIVIFDVNAQTQIHADAVVESSSDFLQTNALVDLDPSNYCYLSASVGVLSSSFITFSFPQAGQAGDMISIDVQGTGGLLNVSLLDNISILLYDESNVNVATATGGAFLSLDLSLTASSVYTLRYMTDVTASYKIKKVKLVLNNLLSVQVLNEFRMYSAMLQTPCTPVFATSVASYSNNLLTGIVSAPTNSISTSTTDFATMKVLVAIPPLTNTASLALNFTTKGMAGEYVGFTVSKASTILTLEVLQSLKIEVFNSSGVLKATKSNFALVDLKLLAGTTDKYYIGFIAPSGSYDIARLKLTMGGISLLNTLNVYNAVHFKLQPAVVNIQSSSTGFCNGSSVTLTASAPGSAILWSNGATTNSITVNTAGAYNFVATDNQGCSSASSAIVVNAFPKPTVTIGNGSTVDFCSNKNILLTSTASAGATVLWSNSATTNDITVNTAGTYTVTATALNGCHSDIASIIVNALIAPTVSINNGSTFDLCSNRNVVLMSTPSSGATVLWSNGATTNDITVNSAGTYSVVATHTNGCKSASASIIINSLVAPVVTITNGSTTSFCANATLTLASTASSGTTVLWSTGAVTNDIVVNAAGTYTVTATATNGCYESAKIIVSTIGIPAINQTVKNVTCNGAGDGSIEISPIDMSANYNYTWSTSATISSIDHLSPGAYSIDISDVNTSCARHEEYTITEPLVLTLQGVAFDETCLGNDGKIELTVNGGTAPYQYNQVSVVNNVFSRLAAASYTITVTDKNNCSATETFAIHAANCNMVLNIHNVITPNNDGLNEVMVIEGIENFPHSNLDILNKWGDVVYSSTYYDNSWSGRNDKDTANLPAGTYYYILKLTTPKVPNGKRDYTGFVMIQ